MVRKEFQSLQGTIPTRRTTASRLRGFRCFNPFKVRSQRSFPASLETPEKRFQSLQGTIPTLRKAHQQDQRETFQSLQGTIPTISSATSIGIAFEKSFNPFKVRSQHGANHRIYEPFGPVSIPSRYDPNQVRYENGCILFKFQSLQGTIPTACWSSSGSFSFRFQSLQGTIPTFEVKVNGKKLEKVSIPSRYDPNTRRPRRSHTVSDGVSIPSRYDPNQEDARPRLERKPLFQSLQGTIPTSKAFADLEETDMFQSLQGTIPTVRSLSTYFIDSKVSIPSRYDPNEDGERDQAGAERVSIPSRYDPNGFSRGVVDRHHPHVSIPSRYDPNVPRSRANSAAANSFNPFKVRSQHGTAIR